MNTKQQIKRTVSAVLFAVMVLASSSLFAQVKIGSNPTTINAANNLEVEASNNKKVMIHKTDGTVVIENVPTGAVTDGIMTIDASGNVRQLTNTINKSPYVNAKGIIVANSGSPGTVITAKPPLVISSGISYDQSSGIFTILESGVYSFALASTGSLYFDAAITSNSHCLYFYNGAAEVMYRSCGRSGSYADESTSLTGISYFIAGSQLKVGLTTATLPTTSIGDRNYAVSISLFKIND